MNWTRKKRRGMKGDRQREWRSDCDQYRITWCKEVFDVAVPPHYYACVRTVNRQGREYWNFVAKRGPYRKFKAACAEAEKHRKIWEAGIKESQSERTGRSERLKLIEAKGGQSLKTIPFWVQPLANAILTNAFGCTVQETEAADRSLSFKGVEPEQIIVAEPQVVAVVEKPKKAKAASRKTAGSPKKPLKKRRTK